MYNMIPGMNAVHPKEWANGAFATTPADFAKLWAAAKAAGIAAANAQDAKLGPEGARGFDCGFAWVNFPGNTKFARWAKKMGLASKHYPSGLSIWYSKFSTNTQSVSVHEAAAQAVRDVLSHGLQSSEIYTGSRLD